MPQVHKTSIGGQALIEGVMMRGPGCSAMAVRKPEGDIHIETDPAKGGKTPWYKRTPILRGSFNFVDSLVVGYKYLMKSADIAGLEESEGELTGFDKKLNDWFGEKSGDIIVALAMVLALVMAVGLFMLLPTFLSGLIRPLVGSQVLMALIESVVKLSIFVIYILLVSRTKEIRRVFEYHGAEHKTIACYEHGEALTPENCQKHSRFHPRCGTSFILIVMVVSVLIFSMVSWDNIWMRIGLKLLSLPIVVGISYEIIKLAGRYDNPVTRVISAPGMWLQRLTTQEPDLSQLEVAIAAMKPCIPESPGQDEY